RRVPPSGVARVAPDGRVHPRHAPRSVGPRCVHRPQAPLTVGVTLWRYFWASPNTFIGLAVVPFVLATRGRIQVIDGVLEAYGGLLPWLLRRAIPLPGGAEAITLGHVVLARDREVLDATRAHERVHVRQYETWGPAFIPAYFLAS